MEEIKILEKIDNPLLNRKEVKIVIESDSSLKADEVEKLISENLATHVDNIKIKQILGKFGSKKFTIIANVYHTKEDKEKTEQKKKDKKAKVEEKTNA
jgi:ribosomal protein S24E